MRRILVALLCVLMLVPSTVALAQADPSHDSEPEPGEAEPVDVYEVEASPEQQAEIREDGFDIIDVELEEQGEKPKVTFEVVATPEEAERLRRKGVTVGLRLDADGMSVGALATLELQSGFNVWRPFSGPGGLREEYEALAKQYSDIVTLETIGESHMGQPIYAFKVTAGKERKGKKHRKPAVLFQNVQHAREWISAEQGRRLLRYFLENYGSDPQVTRLVHTRELWFVPMVNPDGYDYTFTEGNRLWRKNLRDNNDNGEIDTADGVDLNRNWPYRWGYDNEGSSPNPTSFTYRGPSPGSEPEVQAVNGLIERIDPIFAIDTHSAAELLLYGIGWQVNTDAPDDEVLEAIAGDDDNPAVPGYDPDQSSELYTTNGAFTDHTHETYGALAYTPELDTCLSATLFFDDDSYEPSFCEDRSVFEFPDDERLIQEVFDKNLPWYLSIAESADDPLDPETVTGETVPNFDVEPFDVSYGRRQQVAVVAQRQIRAKRMRYRINGGRTRTTGVRQFRGGERYGNELDVYFDEYRGTVRNAREGDTVEVWFVGRKRGEGRVESERFTYQVVSTARKPVLVIANEDYTGVNPVQDITAPAELYAYTEALEQLGVPYDVWDVDAQGVPDDLGVLSHYDAVVWYLGANRLTQDPEDEEITIDEVGFGPAFEQTDVAVAERQQYLTLAVRDFLNEGGKVFHAGETAGYFGVFPFIGGLFYGNNGAPEEECVIRTDPNQEPFGALFGDCLFLSDDFYQYYLGSYARSTVGNPVGFTGIDTPLEGLSALFGGPSLERNPLDEAGNFTVTSDVLPPDEFPQFESWRSAEYGGGDGPGPLEPFDGDFYVGALHEDQSFMRLQRAIDVPGGGGELAFNISFDTEAGFDYVIVELTDAAGNRTTLPTTPGSTIQTSTASSGACDDGQYTGLHPSLLVYDGVGPCQAADAAGSWNAFAGNSGGWQDVAFDLSAYAGQTVTVSISYVTDAAFGGLGVFIDNVRVPGEDVQGFESGLGAWTIPGSPEGSPANGTDFVRSEGLLETAAGVSTEDSVLLGFGLEHIAEPGERDATMERVLDYFGVRTPGDPRDPSTPEPPPAPEDPDVSAILECVVDNGDGTLTARFGYENREQTAYTIPAGPDNKLVGPVIETDGPVEEFGLPNVIPGRPGRTSPDDPAFTATFDASGNLVWALHGRTATASVNSKRCS